MLLLHSPTPQAFLRRGFPPDLNLPPPPVSPHLLPPQDLPVYTLQKLVLLGGEDPDTAYEPEVVSTAWARAWAQF